MGIMFCWFEVNWQTKQQCSNNGTHVLLEHGSLLLLFTFWAIKRDNLLKNVFAAFVNWGTCILKRKETYLQGRVFFLFESTWSCNSHLPLKKWHKIYQMYPLLLRCFRAAQDKPVVLRLLSAHQQTALYITFHDCE